MARVFATANIPNQVALLGLKRDFIPAYRFLK
jgi:hypothetical protein